MKSTRKSVLLISSAMLMLLGLINGCESTGNKNTYEYEPAVIQQKSSVPDPKPEPTQMTEPEPTVAVNDGMVRSVLAYPTGDRKTSVMLLERVAPAEVSLGQSFEYQIMVTNLTKNGLHDVIVTEPISGSFKLDRTNPPSQTGVGNGTLMWKLGDLAPQEVQTITIKGSATQVGTIRDCITLSYTPRSCLAINVVEPKLKLAKTGPAEVLLCEPIPIKFMVTNNGTGVARNVVVKDTLPRGLMTTDGKNKIVQNLGALKPGQSKEFSASLKASQRGTYENKALATGTGGLQAEATHKVVVREPVLKVVKTGPAQRYVGRTVTYNITVTNTGNGDARKTVLVDKLPNGVTFVNASDGGKYSDGKVTWNVGTLSSNASRKVSVKVKATRIGTIRNQATAKAFCAQASAQASTKITGIAAILLEVIDLEDPIEVGSNETYVITVTNQGTAVGTNIMITCTLPAEQTYVSSSGPTTAAVAGKKVSFKPLPRLAAKAKATYRVIVKGTKPGDLRFKVEMKSDQMTSPVMETESTHVYE